MVNKIDILIGFGGAKQTINTLIVIAIIANKANAPKAVKDRCLDHHEYSLIKNIYK
jgi:hypothetical protein